MEGLLSTMLFRKHPVILDGAMGTELQRRGVDIGLPLWSANGLIAHPEIVLQIHKDYVEAGADIITTNTFRTTRRAFRNANLPDRSEALTRSAVDIARKARESFPDHDVLIAGSIAPIEDCYRVDLVPPERELYEEHVLHASRLAEQGVDLLLLETMNTVREAFAACKAAKSTGKEVIVSFVCGRDGRLLSGESIAEAVGAIARLDPSAFSINCVAPRYVGLGLAELKKATSLPLALYANIGSPDDDTSGDMVKSDVNEEKYVGFAADWIAEGVAIVGGCCGTTPAYIRALAQALR